MEDLLNSYSDADITGEEARADARLCILQVDLKSHQTIKPLSVNLYWGRIQIRPPPRNRCHSSSQRNIRLRITRNLHHGWFGRLWEICRRIRYLRICSWRRETEHSSTKNATPDSCWPVQVESWYYLQVRTSTWDESYCNSRAIQDKLGLDEDGVEDLAVRAFQLKLLRGRLDQGNPA